MSNKPMHAVGVSVLLTQGNKVLIGKRGPAAGQKHSVNRLDEAQSGVGLLSTPGGRLELEEEVLDCARREFLEETGASLDDIKLEVFTWRKHNRFGKHYIMFYVHAKGFYGTIGNPEPDKNEGWVFTDIDYLLENAWLTTEPYAVLQELKDRITPPRPRVTIEDFERDPMG